MDSMPDILNIIEDYIIEDSVLAFRRSSYARRGVQALHSHSAKSPKDGDISRWLAMHSHSAKSPKDGDISRWLSPTYELFLK